MSKREAQQAMQAGHFEAARDHLLSILRGADDGPELRYNLAMVLVRLADYSAAIPHLEYCLNAAPGNPDILCNLGNCQRLAGRLTDARHNLDEALRQAPQHLGILANHGWLMLALCEPATALDDFRLLLSLAPESPETHRGYAESLAGTGQMQAAIEALQTAVTRFTTHPGLLAALGALHARNREVEAAYARLGEALDLQADNPEALLSHGICAEQLGETARAEKDFRRAINLRPGLAAAHFHLAHLSTAIATKEDVSRIERALDREKSTQARIELEFALGKSLYKLDDAGAAFKAFTRARNLQEAAAPFPITEVLQRIESIHSCAHRPAESAHAEILFVVGMPRSGTTLVEQVLASHPGVHAFGESGAVPGLLEEYRQRLKRDYPAGLEN